MQVQPPQISVKITKNTEHKRNFVSTGYCVFWVKHIFVATAKVHSHRLLAKWFLHKNRLSLAYHIFPVAIPILLYENWEFVESK